jgi:enoyl-CoA hydratase
MTVRIDKHGAVWTVVHSRPEARNAMDPVSARELFDAFVAFDDDPEAAVAVFWGEGGAFCAGWDLKNAAGLSDDDDGISRLTFTDDGGHSRGPMGPSRLELSKPVIAAVAGPAVAGGMELAMWADIRVMEESAYMGVYCRRWGIPLIDGGTVRLPRLVGEGRALDLILTGRQVMADECERIGLCEYVVADGEARQRAEQIAHQIARFPQLCLRADRRSARGSHGLPMRQALVDEWEGSRTIVAAEGISGARRFAAGAGRGGDFGDIGDIGG